MPTDEWTSNHPYKNHNEFNYTTRAIKKEDLWPI